MIQYNILADDDGTVYFVIGSITIPELPESCLFSVRPVEGSTDWELKSYIHQPPVRFPTWESALADLTGETT